MNKKGVLGIDTIKLVILGLLVIAVLVVAMFMALSSMRDVYESTETKPTIKVVNETVTTVTGAGDTFANETVSYRNADCGSATNAICINSTNYAAIPTTNFTITSCIVKSLAQADFNNTDWKCTYTVTYNRPEINLITSNITVSPANFMKNSSTYFTLLAVVILILIIALVIVAVSRFSGADVSDKMSLSGGGGIGEEL